MKEIEVVVGRDWVNPYKPLCQKTSGILYPFIDRELSAEEIARFRGVCAGFEQIYCELGSGSGMHLIEQARRLPNSLFAGFEVRYKRVYRSYEKSIRVELKNIAFLRADAGQISDFFAAGSLAGVYVNFPDPWEKKRWRKHRMLSREFLEELSRLLKSDGFLSFKTDHRGYFEEVSSLLTGITDFTINACTNSLHTSEFSETNVPTEFENLFKFKGLPVHYLLAKKS